MDKLQELIKRLRARTQVFQHGEYLRPSTIPDPDCQAAADALERMARKAGKKQRDDVRQRVRVE